MLTKVAVKGPNSTDGVEQRVAFLDGFEIVADSGRALFFIRLLPDGSLEVSSGGATCRHNDKTLSGELALRSRSACSVTVTRDEYV